MIKSSNFKEMEEFENKYKEKIKTEFENYKKTAFSSDTEKTKSRQYVEFKKQWMPKQMNLYEKACNLSEKIFKVTPDQKEAVKLQEAINTCHLNITPTGVKSFSWMAPLVFVMVVAFFSLTLPILFNPGGGAESELFFILFAAVIGIILVFPLGKLPEFIANNWRMKSSNQMVLCVFYIVTYMRHTSNLENALDFAAEHLPPPLSLDLKKIIWDVETEKYSSVKESLDVYLEGWKKYNMEFIESIHLVESSLYESSESRRLDSLDKSLGVILDETYEKMLHYAHELQSPLTMLNMLGIVLPILGLVILPLVVSFMSEIKWYHIFALYNIALPVGVYYLGRVVLSTRPTGYGESDISETNPQMKKYRNAIVNLGGIELKFSPAIIGFFVFVVFFLIGISPIIMHMVAPGFDVVITNSGEIKAINTMVDKDAKFYMIGYRFTDDKSTQTLGPFGLGAAILSLFIPLSFGVSLGLYYKLRSQNVIKIREQSKKLEQEFASALFQLGNRLGDGLPAEIAFSKVAEVMEGTTSGKFFELVSMNITKLGMNVESAIFDPKQGAIVHYPSSIIESSMKVLIESSKKGPLIASQALINVSEYIKQIHRVDERLKDLMADTISSMKSQISFLTPAIAGIVMGITSMITTILGSLSDQMKNLNSSVNSGSIGASAGVGGIGGLEGFFGVGIPTFYFQLVVGIYVVQIVYILTVLVNGIQNGSDALNERYLLGKNLISSTVLYVIIALVVTLVFNLIAGVILGGGIASVAG